MDQFVISSIVTLFVTLNPIGNVPIFISLLKRYDESRQRKIIVREVTFALIILLLFGFVGNEILGLLHLDLHTVRIAGGIILFLIALTLLFPRNQSGEKEEDQQEPFIVPLATPVCAGAGSISLVMVMGSQASSGWQLWWIILLSWIPSLIILLLSSTLKKLLGTKGLLALERLSGMLLIFISSQMIVTGFTQFWHASFLGAHG